MYRWIAAFLVLWTGCAPGGVPTWEQQRSRNRPVRHVMVQFTDTTLHPSTAQLLAGGTVSWVNYASLYDGSIVFPPATVAGFACDLRPDWGKTANGAQSIPIPMGGAASDLEIPCPLAPGSYDYEVWLFSPGVGDPSGLDEPEARMQGRIVVE